MLGLSTGQLARFNLLFVPAVQFGTAPSQCTADLKIFDNAGNALASSTVTLLPNQSQTLTYQTGGTAVGATAAPGLNVDPTAVELHAVATVPDCPGHTESCPTSVRLMQHAYANGQRFPATV
jgi:hypothetical protein